MSKKKKIALISFVLIFLVIVAVALANIDLIMVVKNGLFETPETIDLKKEEVSNKEKEALKEAGVENVRPLTEDEKKEYVDGNITKEDAVNIITGKTTIEDVKSNKGNNSQSVANKESTENVSTESQTPEPSAQPSQSENEVNDKIAELIGQVYVLEAKFTSELAALEQWAIREYESVPHSERPAKKKELAAYGWPKLTSLERECDTNLQNILAELKNVLEEAGQSTALVEQIDSAYNEKKQLTKARYISDYL